MNLFIAGVDMVCVLFLSIIIIAMLSSKNRGKRDYNRFFICVVFLLFFSASDGISYIMDEYGGHPSIHFIMNFFSYIGPDFILPAFAYYITEKISQTGSFSLLHARIVFIACIIEFVFITYGSFTGDLFYIENQTIVYGYLNNYIGVVQFIMSVYFLIQIFRHKNQSNKKVLYSTAIYFMIPLVSIIIELFNSTMAFAYLSTSLSFLIVYIIVVREDIQSSILSEEIMFKASVTDNLTGMLNRRAFAQDTETMQDAFPEDFVYMSLDVNELKKVNDTIGHEAGDEIIVGAGNCMVKVLGPYGKIYRTGGDEFIALLSIQEDMFDTVLQEFDEEVDNWHGELVETIAISYGHVVAREMDGLSFHDVSVLADKRMYAAKSAFYSRKGFDRRGQSEAHVALCKLYTKILKINITDNTYRIINMDESEQAIEKGFAKTISEWFINFGKSGYVHKEDLAMYLEMTDISYLSQYFKQDKTSLSIMYRRKYGDVYKKVVMDMIPATDYSHENQSLFLYVKNIDK